MKAIPLILCIFCCSTALSAPRALPEDSLPADSRLDALKDLNGYFPFHPPKSPADWTVESARIRHDLKVAVGLFPEPVRHPLNSVIHGRIDGGDFTAEKVYFETRPGYLLTGTLYRPKSITGKIPGVLCPHGHWNEARFYDCGETKAAQLIKEGAEKHIESARNHIQTRCIGLARLGCTVLQYDMIGYCDNDQISHQLAHRFSKQRPEMISEKDWGLYSPQAESHLQSIMMLQTWNSIRAIDFLQSLPEVDPGRIAVTGASGGGTQTFALSALDPRVTVSMPAVMVGTAMQGGCTCENASLMRIKEGNVAFAALFAPRPLGLTTANDWTREMATKGFPEIRKTYQMLGAPSMVTLHDRTEFDHNYNLPSRQAMYRWFNEHLDLGIANPENERPHKLLTEKDLTVFDRDHPKPVGGDDFERALLASLADEASATISRNPEIARKGWNSILGTSLRDTGVVEWQLTDKNDRGSYLEMPGLHNNRTKGQQVPVIWLYPKNWKRHAAIFLSAHGKSGLYNEQGDPRPEVRALLKDGVSVCGIDLFQQGEFLRDGKPVTETRRVKNPREAACYTQGYNRPLFAQRVADILSAIRLIQTDQHGAKKITLVGLAGSGHWAAAAHFLAGKAIHRAAIESSNFDFIKVTDIRHPDLMPGASKYGGMKGLLDLASQKAWNVDANGLPEWLK